MYIQYYAFNVNAADSRHQNDQKYIYILRVVERKAVNAVTADDDFIVAFAARKKNPTYFRLKQFSRANEYKFRIIIWIMKKTQRSIWIREECMAREAIALHINDEILV